MAANEASPAARTAALFPGQGVQRPGLGAPWSTSRAWELVEEVSQAADLDVAHLLLEADADHLARTDRAQLAVFTASLLSWRSLEDVADFASDTYVHAGHSLGEYTALVAAGALSVYDGARLVAARGRAMARAARSEPGAMAAVTAGQEATEVLVAEVRVDHPALWLANFNGPRQTVVAGAPDAVEALGRRAEVLGVACTRLAVSAACHTPLMGPAAEELAQALESVEFAPVHTPVVANVDAAVHTRGADWPALCLAQLTGPVHWHGVLGTLRDTAGCTGLLDVGPGRTMAGLARRAVPELAVQRADQLLPSPV
ncbi:MULTISPECIES: ACP S-malonyltransferase [unclassified Streptomyces]|uniref:ACP S-malonyltransferase n=1 Tax=unclassified Streptomyces TaxID=2593676 RepID=UPI002E16E72F|nr:MULTISPECIES: ACP S-malonyltransferase [unclassified Streptomyces]